MVTDSSDDRALPTEGELQTLERLTPAAEKFPAARVEGPAFLESVLNASKDCIKVLTFGGELVFMNSGGKVVMEVDDFEALRGCDWTSFWEGEGHHAAKAALDAARAGGIGHFEGFAKTARGTQKYWDVTVTRVPGAGGAADHILSISRDITEAKQAQQRQSLLSHELSHRVKNSLSVVQAIAMQTFRGSDEGQLRTFNGRLAALGKAQDLLLAAAWAPVPLRDVVEETLGLVGPAGRWRADGPAYALDGQRGLSLALALYELGTNAVKYGALSGDRGEVEVSWSVEEGALHLSWEEKGGPIVTAPTRKGFGTRLITQNLEADFRGTVDLRYLSSGVVLTLSAPA